MHECLVDQSQTPNPAETLLNHLRLDNRTIGYLIDKLDEAVIYVASDNLRKLIDEPIPERPTVVGISESTMETQNAACGLGPPVMEQTAEIVARYEQETPQFEQGRTLVVEFQHIKALSYNFSRNIGSGGFADVFYAKCEKSGLELAVKRLKEDKQAEKQFDSEISHPRIQNHPNIVSGSECLIFCILSLEFLEGFSKCYRPQCSDIARLPNVLYTLLHPMAP